MKTAEDYHLQFKAKVKRSNFWSARVVHFDNNYLSYFKTDSKKTQQIRSLWVVDWERDINILG